MLSAELAARAHKLVELVIVNPRVPLAVHLELDGVFESGKDVFNITVIQVRRPLTSIAQKSQSQEKERKEYVQKDTHIVHTNTCLGLCNEKTVRVLVLAGNLVARQHGNKLTHEAQHLHS